MSLPCEDWTALENYWLPKTNTGKADSPLDENE